MGMIGVVASVTDVMVVHDDNHVTDIVAHCRHQRCCFFYHARTAITTVTAH